jgi:hypothetical protein
VTGALYRHGQKAARQASPACDQSPALRSSSVPLSMAAPPGGSGVPSRRADGLDLGWCAGSTVLPRKQHAIEGVGAASILALQATLYRTQARGCRFSA